MDRAVVHNLTFANNDLAMAAGLATLDVLESDGLVENAARMGARLLATFQVMASDYEMVREVRGKGLMIGIEFGRPRSLKLQAAWGLLEAVSTGLFCQLITIPLCTRHRGDVPASVETFVAALPALSR
jgi:ornithine--oxo-acid transaminase